jgi:hypothetical protein
MDQFDAGKPWDVVKHTTIEGGHAIAAVGYDVSYVYVVTWGKLHPMTWAFWDAYVEEAWTQLSTEFVNSVSGQDPLGETLHALGEQYAALTGQANPVPAPAPQPTPTPAPTPAPGPDSFPAGAYEAFRAAAADPGAAPGLEAEGPQGHRRRPGAHDRDGRLPRPPSLTLAPPAPSTTALFLLP